jgi:hypothetical protein
MQVIVHYELKRAVEKWHKCSGQVGATDNELRRAYDYCSPIFR